MITSLNNFSGIQKEVDVALITLDDNIVHTYCSEISWQKDNSTPIGIAKLKIPYSPQIEQYWVKYSGAVIIHANLNNKPQITQNEYTVQSQMPKQVVTKKENNKIRLQNDEYNYSFIGKVHKFKQEGKKFILFLEDLGWKFLQKVPDEFRQTYIAGQTLDNAFQAICEFMGIDFAYSIEKLSEYNFSADGYSIEKDGSIIESVPSIFEGIKESDAEEEGKTEDQKMADVLYGDKTFEASGLIEYEKNKNNQVSNQSSNQALNQSITNGQTSNTNNNKEDKENPKTKQYQEEFDRKIEDLFKGNTFYASNISDSILNYNWISVNPTQTSTTTDTNQNTIQEEANNEGIQTNTGTNSELNAETK